MKYIRFDNRIFNKNDFVQAYIGDDNCSITVQLSGLEDIKKTYSEEKLASQDFISLVVSLNQGDD